MRAVYGKVLELSSDRLIKQGKDRAFKKMASYMLQTENYSFKEIAEITELSIENVCELEIERVIHQKLESIVAYMLDKGTYSLEEIADIINLPLEEVKRIKEERK